MRLRNKYLHGSSEDRRCFHHVESRGSTEFQWKNRSIGYLTRCLETKSDIAAVSHGLLALRAQTFLAIEKDRRLLLERALGLQARQYGTLIRRLSVIRILDISTIPAYAADLTTCYAASVNSRISIYELDFRAH